MSTSQFILEGYCQGAYPVDGLDEIACEEWHNEILEAIRVNDLGAALRIAKEHFIAEYNIENVSRFEDNGIRYIKTIDTNLNLPFIENDGSTDMPLFKWVGAHFLMESPTEIVSEWLQTDDDGKQYFSQEKFDDWLGSDDYLQDGCRYILGSCCYDLEGFGQNGCSVDPSSVLAGIGKELGLSDVVSTNISQKTVKKKQERKMIDISETYSNSTETDESIHEEVLSPEERLEALLYSFVYDCSGMDCLDENAVARVLNMNHDEVNELVLGMCLKRVDIEPRALDCVRDFVSACNNQFSPVFDALLRNEIIEKRIEYWSEFRAERSGFIVPADEETEDDTVDYGLARQCGLNKCLRQIISKVSPDLYIDQARSNNWSDRFVAAAYASGEPQCALQEEIDEKTVSILLDIFKQDPLVANNLYVVREAAGLPDDLLWSSKMPWH